jgi:toxin ParE1/3/4
MIFELSKRAQADIEDIARYTLDNFGIVQTENYINGLYDSFALLTDNPRLGRDWSGVRRRYIYRMHYVYYRLVQERVFITHIRHTSRVPL